MATDQMKARRRDVIVAAACGVFVAGMVGMAYASVPLYDWFCRATGFGGRTQVATGAPWRFEPEQNSIEVRLGEVVTVNYVVTNLAARTTVGQAAYNVTPTTIGLYFQKINCFCFTEQKLKAGERREMPVVFYVDPAMVKDWEQDDLNTITLSYSFYPVREPSRPVAEGNTTSGRL